MKWKELEVQFEMKPFWLDPDVVLSGDVFSLIHTVCGSLAWDDVIITWLPEQLNPHDALRHRHYDLRDPKQNLNIDIHKNKKIKK